MDKLLEELKEYLRIGSEDDVTLTLLLNSAKSFLTNAGVIEPEQINEPLLFQYKLALFLYVKKEYDALDKAMYERTEKAINTIVLQLKDYKGDADESS